MNKLLRKIIIISAAVFCAGISDVVDLFILEKSENIILSALEETGEEILLGDISFDGVIDSSDASLILAEYSKILVGKESILRKEQAKAADVDRDGTIDSTDASWILAYYSAISTGKDITIEELIAKITGG